MKRKSSPARQKKRAKTSASKPSPKSAPSNLVKKLRSDIVALSRKALIAERMRFEKVKRTHSHVDGEMLAAGVAHEINNILGAVDGHADWALESGKIEDMREALDVIRQACKRSSQVTRALQGLSQPREETHDVFSLAEVAREAHTMLLPECRRSQIDFRVECEGEATVYGASSRILEIVVNLVRNSIDALNGSREERATAGRASQDKISIHVVEKRKHVFLRVSDNGAGIPEVYRQRIFTPFFTTKGVLRRAQKVPVQDSSGASPASESGNGLGLFLSRSIAEEHGGTLKLVETDSGAIFELQLSSVGTK